MDRKILVVDDESVIRKNVISKLNRMQHPVRLEIYEAEDAVEGEALFERICPQLVITDIRMPRRSGLQMVKHIRKKSPDCCIFVLSGFDDYEYVREAFLVGITDYLLKPLSFHELSEKILKNCVDKLLQQEESELPEKLEVHDERVPPKMKAAASYICDNLIRNPSMQECADYCGMSYSYFSKMFKSSFGVSYSQYLIRRRMELAKQLLEDPTYRITDIARRFGYDNPNHFSRAFHRVYGIYPKNYRNNFTEKDESQCDCLEQNGNESATE